MHMTNEEKDNKKDGEGVAVLAQVVSAVSAPATEKSAPAMSSSVAAPKEGAPARRERGSRGRMERFSKGGRGGKRGGGQRGGERAKPEFEQKVIDIRRVTRVVSGGRRFSFSVALVAGNRKGSVGVGIGKSSDTSSAIEKATRNAKKNMIKLKLNKHMSIPHEVEAKFASTRVLIKPSPGKGLVAGSSVRNVLDLGGVKDVSSKLFSRSKNKLNNARAAIEALKRLR